MDLTPWTWRKSSYSGADSGNGVEVASAARTVAARDFRDLLLSVSVDILKVMTGASVQVVTVLRTAFASVSGPACARQPSRMEIIGE
jgi:hypothetical protein